METVIRGLLVYAALLAIFRVAGKRTLAESSPFELVLLLIISETVQDAMVDSDHSMTNGFLLILTLVGASVALSVVKQRLPRAERLLEGGAVVVVRDGRLHRDRVDRLRIGGDEIMAAARQAHGLWRLDQVRHAVVETSGQISVTPWEEGERPA